jgi:hypothetical protein
MQSGTPMLALKLPFRSVIQKEQIMSYVKKLTFVLAVALLVFASRSARADEYDRLMIVTFSGTVRAPGVVLPAGTYQFKLAEPDSDRNLVQILSGDGSRVYATLMTIPDTRPTPTDEAVVTFEERAAGSAEAIRAIFYPGDTTGMAFVYPTDDRDGGSHVVHGKDW